MSKKINNNISATIKKRVDDPNIKPLNVKSKPMFEEDNPGIKTFEGDEMRYNRRQRRSGTFVIQNNQNAKYIHYAVNLKTKITKVKDVELDEASTFSFVNVKFVISKLLVGSPNFNIGYVLVVKRGEKRIAI